MVVFLDVCSVIFKVWPFFGFIDGTAKDFDRKQDEREEGRDMQQRDMGRESNSGQDCQAENHCCKPSH